LYCSPRPDQELRPAKTLRIEIPTYFENSDLEEGELSPRSSGRTSSPIQWPRLNPLEWRKHILRIFQEPVPITYFVPAFPPPPIAEDGSDGQSPWDDHTVVRLKIIAEELPDVIACPRTELWSLTKNHPRITDEYMHYWADQAYAAFNYRGGLAAYCALRGSTSTVLIDNIIASHGRIRPRTPPPTGGDEREEGGCPN
jgi:hypothetical protein